MGWKHDRNLISSHQSRTWSDSHKIWVSLPVNSRRVVNGDGAGNDGSGSCGADDKAGGDGVDGVAGGVCGGDAEGGGGTDVPKVGDAGDLGGEGCEGRYVGGEEAVEEDGGAAIGGGAGRVGGADERGDGAAVGSCYGGVRDGNAGREVNSEDAAGDDLAGGGEGEGVLCIWVCSSGAVHADECWCDYVRSHNKYSRAVNSIYQIIRIRRISQISLNQGNPRTSRARSIRKPIDLKPNQIPPCISSRCNPRQSNYLPRNPATGCPEDIGGGQEGAGCGEGDGWGEGELDDGGVGGVDDEVGGGGDGEGVVGEELYGGDAEGYGLGDGVGLDLGGGDAEVEVAGDELAGGVEELDGEEACVLDHWVLVNLCKDHLLVNLPQNALSIRSSRQ